ncbi:MAG: DUF5686 and carboxypeptidase regulatory-like domain-containing protein [Cytophagales bacterium]|nr:DUF5686 and carboxypeptidase regulatory-like domain-containing protein [Cytophagales bacterium]
MVIVAKASAQEQTEVVGIVVDEKTSEPLEFANVYFKGTTSGTVSDSDGYFSLSGSANHREIIISIVGYDQKIVQIKPGKRQTITVRLKTQLVNLDEIVVMSGENPAWSIIREAVKKKKDHDKRNLTAYEYQSYNRIEFDIDNISTRLRERKMVRDIWEGIDSASLEKNAKGNAILPVFLSESVSRYYVKNNPFARREEVQKTKVSGVAVEDGSMVSQLVGTAYQDYNFYQNWLRFLEKEFISPISDNWKMYYDYEILDTLHIEKDECYELAIFPNREQDPAFNGKIWITTNEFALKKLDLYIDKATNLNFIERIVLQQELNKVTGNSQWLPSKTNLVVDVSDLGKNTASFLLKVYNTTSDWKINEVKDKKFYSNEVNVWEDFSIHDPDYWEKARPESLTQQQLKTYQVIDTLVEIPRVKSYVELVKLITTGYWRRGKFDIGPYLYSYAHNNFEGHAIRLGLKTNEYFHRKITIRGYAGYGTADQTWKYGINGSYIITRKPWTEFRIHSSSDVEQVGIRGEDLIDNNHIFYAATRWQTFRRPYYITDNQFNLQSEPTKGLMHKLTLRHEYYDPQYPFYYYENPGHHDSNLKSDLSSPSLKFTTRWARDEMFVQDGNSRISLGPRRSPIIQLDYTYGFKDVLESDFEYHKVRLEFLQKIRMGGLGESRLKLRGGYIFGQLPYLLLENHIGNESMFYTTGAFNTMNYFEFVSDKYASLHYQHYFQGLLLNKIPLMRKLKWRLLWTANMLSGSLRQENIDIMATEDPEGNPTPGFNFLDPQTPYIELGYGIENIFKIIRVDAVHRITYRDRPEAQKFALKFSLQFKL